ncbi:MAG: DUF349 domain-containing protein, partial [Bacteroidota bacterium]|nr:DUF349 domain-containing protein [Bacteroidota bacterium]
MEPKDLKNSKNELSGTQVEPETINDQDVAEVAEEQIEVAEVTESEEAVVKTVTEPVEVVVEEKVTGVEESIVAEEPTIVEEAVEVEETVEAEEVIESAETVPEEVAAVVEESEVAEEPTEAEEVVDVEETVEVEEIVEESVTEPEVESVVAVTEEEVAEVEESVEDNSQKDERTDYAALNEVELINALRVLLEGDDDRIKDDVEAIKVHFFRLYRANIEAQKAAFIEAGGDVAEFKAEPDPNELDLRELLKQYQDERNDRNKKIDELKDENLQKKYDIIEEIKALINNKESINRTFHEFRELQNRWREIGLVPQAKLKDLWETYHHHVENFYDFIKINKELRDLDLKKNLEIKMEICEKSEELLVEPSIIKAFNILQKYHEQWREVGPVPRDKKDELWER